MFSKVGDTQYWATDVMAMQEKERKKLAKKAWKIEEYHRGIKQFCGVERCQARRNDVQRCAENTYHDGTKSISQI
jgi:IS4 transposase